MESTILTNMKLLDAASSGDLGQLGHLLALGADPNCRDVLDGSTCLHEVAAKGIENAIQLLVTHGADPNISTQNTGASPLGVAALAGHLGAVKTLLACGARLSEPERATNLLQECRDLGLTQIADLIDAASAWPAKRD